MIIVRIIIYGVLTGLVWNYANLCLSIWMIFEMSFGVIYIWKKPFALETQNYIYGIVSLIYSIAMILIIVINQYKGGGTKLITNF